MLVKPPTKSNPPLPAFQILQDGSRIEIAVGTACPHCDAAIRCSDARTIGDGLRIICANGHTFLTFEPR
jgi:hypothetical protein